MNHDVNLFRKGKTYSVTIRHKDDWALVKDFLETIRGSFMTAGCISNDSRYCDTVYLFNISEDAVAFKLKFGEYVI